MSEISFHASFKIKMRHLIMTRLACRIFLYYLFNSSIPDSFKESVSNSTLDEDVYKPYPCLCASNDINDLRAVRCFNDPAVECEPCSRTVCGSWSKWSSWSDCSKTCGGGERSRDRKFTWYDGTTFDEVESEDCNTGNCYLLKA